MSKEKDFKFCHVEMTNVTDALVCTRCGFTELLDCTVKHMESDSCQCDDCIEKRRALR